MIFPSVISTFQTFIYTNNDNYFNNSCQIVHRPSYNKSVVLSAGAALDVMSSQRGIDYNG